MPIDEKTMVGLLRLINHDFLNHYQVIAGYLQLGRNEQALAYLRETVDTFYSRGHFFRWIYPSTILMLLRTQYKFLKEAKTLLIQSDTTLQDIGVTEEELNRLLGTVLNTIENRETSESSQEWLLKVGDNGEDYVFEFSTCSGNWCEDDWNSARNQAEKIGCCLKYSRSNNRQQLVCIAPKRLSG